mgnify:CR=1 FL=1
MIDKILKGKRMKKFVDWLHENHPNEIESEGVVNNVLTGAALALAAAGTVGKMTKAKKAFLQTKLSNLCWLTSKGLEAKTRKTFGG